VLLAVFHYLDDISLWQATKVCTRWQSILNAELCEDQWKRFIDRRWPLFQPQYSVTCWKVVYSQMYASLYFVCDYFNIRQHSDINDCLENNREDYQNCHYYYICTLILDSSYNFRLELIFVFFVFHIRFFL